MSLFISIITTLYGFLSPKQHIYYMLETLEVRSISQADKEYSSLVSVIAPLNFIHIFFAPILLTSKTPKTRNQHFLILMYLPIMLIFTVIFFIYNFILVPLTFVKLFFHKLVMIFVYSKSYRVSRADKFMNAMVWLAIGLPFLLLNCITDLYWFLKHIFIQDLTKTKHKTSA